MNKTYSKKDFFNDLFYDILGSVIFAVSVNSFAKPAHFATGGVGGLALISNYLFSMPIGVTQMIINIPLILLSYKILGKFFILRTAKTMLVMSFIMDALAPVLPRYGGDVMLASLFTGILDGMGLVLIYLRGGSTGGVDFLTMSIRKSRPHISLGSLSMAVNFFVLTCGALAFKNIDAALYGALATFTSGTIVDKIMYGAGAGKMLLIITDKGKEVARAIDRTTGRGSSIMEIKGAYTGESKQMIISAMSKNQVFAARKNAHDIDPESFVMISSTDEVFGNGFKENHE